MPVPSLFRRKSSGTKDRAQAKSSVDECVQAFSSDESLLQLHAETTELLRLVKTPAKNAKSPGCKRHSAENSLAKRVPLRETIEVLEDDDDNEKHENSKPMSDGAEPTTRPASSALGQASDASDPFAFEAEEARVRRSNDTFVPDTSPSKRDVGRQRGHLTAERERLRRIERQEVTAAERLAYEVDNRPVINRIEDSAIKIQAHSRGFLVRKHADDNKRRKKEEAEHDRRRREASSWHEVRDIERQEVWYYNSMTGQSQWERPAEMAPLPELPSLQPSSSDKATSNGVLPRVGSQGSDLPPLSPSTSRPSSSSSFVSGSSSRPQSSSIREKSRLPALTSPGAAFDYTSASTPWECESVAGSSSSEQTNLYSERLEDDIAESERHDFSRGRRATLRDAVVEPTDDDDWQVNDSLFLADGSKNSKLRDTIRNALQTSKFDSISSLVASNVVLRKKPVKGRQSLPESVSRSPNQRTSASPSRNCEIVLGRRDVPMFVAVLDKRPPAPQSHAIKVKSKRRPVPLPIGTDPLNPLASSPQIRDVVDPGLYEDLGGPINSALPSNDQRSVSPEKTSNEKICFNCWSSSNGRHCDAHADASDFRKIKSAESALMCANWILDQLRKKYRAEEIQEIFMKQNASLRYDKRLKQYVTIVEARHPIYRITESLTTAWNKTMRRKLHTRAWFRSFIEQLRAGGVPKADTSTPKLMKLKNTIQNNRWCTKYSDSVREFHPKAPTTAKNLSGMKLAIPDVIMVDPAHPQPRHWVLKTEYTKPIELYKPRKYELPPRRCVPMPTPTFLEDIPLPVPNVFIDCGHILSWFERLSSRITTAALNKALLQIQACSPPRGVTDARRTKHVTPVTVMFATFGRKPTKGMIAVGGLSAELLIHMLVTTYIPAQYGHFIVFDRRSVAPQLTKDYDAMFACLEIDPKTMIYVVRPLEHALNVRRPPCITIATKVSSLETEDLAANRFPGNRPEQTGEELARGFRTFWLVEAFVVPDQVDFVSVEPTADVLSPNNTSMNPTVTTKVDRFYPFCIPTTKENTPIEFIHLLWIGQSSRNQPQTFTTLGAQQPGDFMRNSDPNGALGLCTSVIYRSWAYMQSSPYEEFCTDEGVAYWYDKQNGDTFWTRPILPTEKHRGKDGDVDGVVVHGHGEVATLGVGADDARYAQDDVRKYMTTKMESPEEKDKRIQRVSASARKHDLVVTLVDTTTKDEHATSKKTSFTKVQVPKLEFKKKNTSASSSVLPSSPVKAIAASHQMADSVTQESKKPLADVDATTKQLIASITHALGTALPNSSGAPSGVDMLQLGIGLGMGLGLRSQQSHQPTELTQRKRSAAGSSRSIRSRPRSADSQVTFAEDIDEGGPEDVENPSVPTSRSDASSFSDESITGRSVMSIATSVDVTPSPDELELLPEAEKAKILKQQAGLYEKTPGYRTHPPPGEGQRWIDKPINASAESQTAVEGFSGSLHQRVACLPKDFISAVSSTKTCRMQANYLPVIKNTNQPRSVGIVRPRPALVEWLAAEYSPWSAGRSIFGTQFIRNLMQRPEIIAAQKSGASSLGTGTSGSPTGSSVHVEKKENVTQAVKEAQQLETVFSLCRHGKYDELERMITSPDWTLAIDAKDVTGNTLLSIACQNNNKRIAKLCLRRGADINTQNLNGQTLLHYCHEYGFHDLMDYLLDKGARDDIVDADGLTCYEGLSKEAVDAI